MQVSTPANNRHSNNYFLFALGLINVVGFTLLLCSLGLLVGLTISKWQFPVAIILSLVTNYYAARFFSGEKFKSFIKTGAAVLAFVAGSILFAGYFYDVSFDGQWYHMEIVNQLKQGYNPVYQNVQVPADEQVITSSNNWCMDSGNPVANVKQGVAPVNLKYLTINYFSKGAETTAAAIYQCTGHIETGKSINVILLIASFFLTLSLLYKVDRIGTLSKWLLAIIVAFNPVVLNELLTYCVDGVVASLLLCLLAIFCLLLIQYNRYYLFMLAALIIIAVNIKFTSLVFTGMFCVGFLIILLIFKNAVPLKKVIVTGIVAAVIGIFCCGFNPYVTNTIRQHNVFYGIDETRNELARIQTPIMANRNRFENLFISLASHQDNDDMHVTSLSQILKVPFTFNKTDIIAGTYSETWFCGFGPFFSGALCAAIIILVIGLIYFRKTYAFKLSMAALTIILITVFIVPDCWWARFVPQLWLVPVIILCMAEFNSFAGKRVLNAIIYIALLLNVAWASLMIIFTLVTTERISYQVQQLKALNQPVYIEYCYFRNFKSNQVRYAEAGIPIAQKDNDGKYQYDISYSTTKILTQKRLPEVPKSALEKLSEWILSKKGGN